MWMILSVLLQTVGLAGAQAAAANLVGQAMIHGLAVAAGPIGWVASGIYTGYTVMKAINSNSNSTQTSDSSSEQQ
jgi:hypothetical protein